LGAELDRPVDADRQAGSTTPQASATGGTQPLPVEVRQPPPSPFDLAEQILGPVLGPLATIGIILVVTIFILMQREDLRDRLIRLFGSNDLHRTTAAMDDAARRLSKFFLTQLAMNTVFGIIVGTGLFFIGVPSFALWGILAALMRFIPYVGAITSAVPPLLLAAAVDPGWSMVVWTAVLFVSIDIVIGQIVEPVVYGHSTGLSPVAVVVAAIFWTWLWGPIGLLLSTPLTLCFVVLGRHIDRLEFIDVILGDRPALTPAQNCYQRLLAGDADEIVVYAETLLKERSLSSYYDEVVLKGLQLAAADAVRGVLTPFQVERINETVVEIVAELDEYDDVEPDAGEVDDGPVAPPESERSLAGGPSAGPAAPQALDRSARWSHEKPVLCVAGRGPLDPSVALLTAQLLGKHGLVTRIAETGSLASRAVTAIDLSGVAAVIVASVSIQGAPAHLRYALRRLRARRPDALLIAGFWDEDGSIAETDGRTSLAADLRVTSLRQAVQSCVEASSVAADEGPANEVVASPPRPLEAAHPAE